MCPFDLSPTHPHNAVRCDGIHLSTCSLQRRDAGPYLTSGPASLFSAALLIDVAETGPGYMRYDPLMPHSGRMIGISGPRDYSRLASAGGGMMCRIDAALHTEMYL